VDPRLLARILRYGSIGALGLAALFMMLTGRFAMGLLPAAIAFAMWRAMRSGGPSFPFGAGGGAGGTGRSSPGRTSDVDTDFLHMSLDHDSGDMTGEVRQGRFAGSRLDDLSLEQLIELLHECQVADPQSAQLLETYIDRTHGPEWRDTARPGGGGERQASSDGAMTVEEAREILGVTETADVDEIRAAHHRLMLKNHPDKGGSSYLAAKINQAKDILLQS